MIELHTLGDTLIKVGDKEIRPNSPMVFAMLLYLATERGRRVPRPALQEMFFPDSDERSGAHSLRQLLYKLRQLGVPVEGDARTVVLPADAVGDTSHEPALENIRPFLPGYTGIPSEVFNHWLDGRRAAVTAHQRLVLGSAIDHSRMALKWPSVERLARRLLELDPLNDRAVLALAEATALSGNSAAALRFLEEHQREIGKTDLTLPATLLHRRIRDSLANPRRPKLPPFIGRDDEIRVLQNHISSARAGQTSMHLITGEPGIGKSRLLEEVLGFARLQGTKVFLVRTERHYGVRPLSVFIDVVPALRATRGALGVAPRTLAVLDTLSQHSDLVPDRSVDATDALSRYEHLCLALRDLVDAVTSEQPIVLAIDDAQWADLTSLRILNELVTDGRIRRFCVVLTSRTKDTVGSLPKVGLQRLLPLGTAEMTLLCTELLQGTGNHQIVDWCVMKAAGNPLFLEALCAQYARFGVPDPVPPDVESVIRERLDHLSASSKRVLQFTALLGKHCSTEALTNVLKRDRASLLDEIEVLEREGFLQLANATIRVSHDILAEAVVRSLPPIALRTAHGTVAMELESLYDRTKQASVMWDCAQHWRLSGETTKALEFVYRCARHLRLIGQPTEALALLDSHSEAATLLRRELLIETALAAKACVQWHRAHSAIVELARSSTWGERPALDPDLSLLAFETDWFANGHYEPSLSRIRHVLDDRDIRVEQRLYAARLLLSVAHECCSSELAHRAYSAVEPLLSAKSPNFDNRVMAAHYHTIFGDRDVALDLALQLLSEADTFSADYRMRALTSATAFLSFLGDHELSVSHCARYAKQCEATGLHYWQLQFTSAACSSCLSAELVEDAIRWHEASKAVKVDYMLNWAQTPTIANAAVLALLHGNYSECAELIAKLSGGSRQSKRLSGYVEGLKLQLDQRRDSAFVLAKPELQRLLSLHREVRSFGSADSLAQPLAEDLRRRGMGVELHSLIREYGEVRREYRSTPSWLTELRRSCTSASQSAVRSLALGKAEERN